MFGRSVLDAADLTDWAPMERLFSESERALPSPNQLQQIELSLLLKEARIQQIDTTYPDGEGFDYRDESLEGNM